MNHPNIQGYLYDADMTGMTSEQCDALEAHLETLEQTMIAIHRLILPPTIQSQLYAAVNTIWDNSRDLAFDPLFTDQG